VMAWPTTSVLHQSGSAVSGAERSRLGTALPLRPIIEPHREEPCASEPGSVCVRQPSQQKDQNEPLDSRSVAPVCEVLDLNGPHSVEQILDHDDRLALERDLGDQGTPG
jgi:hypothetical protein